MTREVAYLTATALRTCYASGELSPIEVVQALAGRINALDGQLNILVTPMLDHALREAGAAGGRYRDGTARPLEGVPIVVKDLIDTADARTTYGSRMFAGHIPRRDAAIVSRIRAAGAIVIGKSATHEFGWGITTGNEHFGPTRNPWAPDLVPGGSSGGSAAALAAGFAPLALGTDTGGSVRIPAAFCGVVGLRPTHGSLDMAGIHPFAPSLDQVGPMARTIADVRMLFSAMAGESLARDPVSRASPELVVGICRDLDQVTLDPAVASARDAAATALAERGAKVIELHTARLPRVYQTLATVVLAEGSFTHRRAGLWPQRSAEYGAGVCRRLELADTVGLDDYLRAQEDRRLLGSVLSELLTPVDVLLSPVSAVAPEPVGSEADDDTGGLSFRELVMTSTASQSLTGLPACAVRGGFDDNGLPIGIQLTGRPGAERRILDAAQLLYDATAQDQQRWPRPLMP